MSIFFIHVLQSFLGFVLFASLLSKEGKVKDTIVSSAVGLVVGILFFKVMKYYVIEDKVKLVSDIYICIFLLLSLLVAIFKFNIYRIVIFILLGLGFGFNYSHKTSNFPIFGTELLDSVGLINLFYICLSLCILVLNYFFLSNARKFISKKILAVFLFIITICLVLSYLSSFALELMRAGVIRTQTELLSIVAKGIYYTEFLPYFLLFLIAIIAILLLPRMPKAINRDSVKNSTYRINKAKRNGIKQNIIGIFILGFVMLFFALYYDLVASVGLAIDKPQIVEPIKGKITFDANIVKDNKLHRFAYITDEGHEIRFFLINRFSDRLAPVLVLDACSICGDMGYVVKGGNLICISCNVRIFLPSVGRAGGCNPIPINYTYDGKTISVTVKELDKQKVFFSKVVDKEVTDPVSRKKIINTKTNSTYLYYDKVYYFENDKNEEEFEKNPEKYVTTDGELK